MEKEKNKGKHMERSLQTRFQTRQYMVSRDFEIYYYNDCHPAKVSLHTHDYYEFYFFIEGDVEIRIGDEVFRVEHGDIMVVPPGVVHCPIFHEQHTAYRRFVFWVSESYYRQLTAQSADYAYIVEYVRSSGKYIFHNDQIAFNRIQAKVLELIENMRSDYFGRDAQVLLGVNDLILHLNRMAYESSHPRKRNEEGVLYQKAAAYIEDHLSEDLSLETLAAAFYVSKYHIAHVFKEKLGVSVHQYITKKRLVFCREAILGGMSITEAYQMAGFGDYSGFYRAFKKEYGISPKDFRDMQTFKCD